MKVTNWKSKVASALLAAGLAIPTAHAANIPLGDPSFEAFSVVGFGGAGSQYAYANQYRPTSAWVDDQDHNASPYFQDDAKSSWLYSAGYAELATKRGAPRTGVQAMHGFFRYSSQETSAVFEAGKTYTFSIYAQGDSNAVGAGTNWNSRVFLYLFDGSLPFSEANSLTFKRFSPAGDSFNQNDFVNRDPSWTAAQSQAGWKQISLSFTAQAGAPYLGHTVGVGFWAGDDACLDDASLTSVVPEPATALMAGAGAMALAALRRRK